MLPTEQELQDKQRRIGWWLLVARLSAGKTQGDAGNVVGLVASSYGDFERAVTLPTLRQLAVLAAFLEVPLSLFADPPKTDEERLEDLTGTRSFRTTAADEEPARRRRAANE